MTSCRSFNTGLESAQSTGEKDSQEAVENTAWFAFKLNQNHFQTFGWLFYTFLAGVLPVRVPSTACSAAVLLKSPEAVYSTPITSTHDFPVLVCARRRKHCYMRASGPVTIQLILTSYKHTHRLRTHPSRIGWDWGFVWHAPNRSKRRSRKRNRNWHSFRCNITYREGPFRMFTVMRRFDGKMARK